MITCNDIRVDINHFPDKTLLMKTLLRIKIKLLLAGCLK